MEWIINNWRKGISPQSHHVEDKSSKDSLRGGKCLSVGLERHVQALDYQQPVKTAVCGDNRRLHLSGLGLHFTHFMRLSRTRNSIISQVKVMYAMTVHE